MPMEHKYLGLSRTAIVGATLVFGGLVFGGLLSTVTYPSDATSPFQPPRIGVIDVERVFEQSNERTVLEKQIFEEFDPRSKTLKDLDQEIGRLEKEKILVVNGSDAYRTLEKSIVIKRANLKFGMEELQKDLDQRRTEAFEKVYEMIYRKTKAYAQSQDIDLVFQRQLTIRQNAPAWESVFYFIPELDITDDVIASVNRE